MASQRDVKNKIGSVKNIQKITRAMEMVAAARLRRAEQRITALRPYANAIRRMTRQAGQAAGGAESARVPLLAEHESESAAAVLLVTGDRGLAGAFNSQVIRAGVRMRGELGQEGLRSVWYATGRRGVSSLSFRGYELEGSYVGFSDRPSYADARTIADDLMTAYVEGRVDRVEMVYNAYISPLRQTVTHERLLPLAKATIAGEEASEGEQAENEDRELAVLQEFMPAQLSEDEIEQIVDDAIAEVGATSLRDLGRVMADVMPQVSGRADGSTVTQVVREKLA